MQLICIKQVASAREGWCLAAQHAHANQLRHGVACEAIDVLMCIKTACLVCHHSDLGGTGWTFRL